jgi:hypothetical protein
MSHLLSKRFKQLMLIFALLFVLLFFFRLGYGYVVVAEESNEDEVYFEDFSSDNKKNYASDKSYTSEKEMGQQELQTMLPSDVGQKYEKIAKVNSKSKKFEEDEKKVRDEVEKWKGIIQYERKTGNEGKRSVQLQIGVPPVYFDTLYKVLIGVGKIDFKEIIKNDKTNDYLELNARKSSLEKTLASLVEFKQKNGQIDEFINLQNRILEMEENLQQLGVNLGDFDQSNEFCTIQFSMVEYQTKAQEAISFYHRSKVALQWAFSYFLYAVSSLFFVVLGCLLALIAVEKGRKLFQGLKK